MTTPMRGLMRVCYDFSAALAQDAGIGRYTRELALALSALPDAPQLTLFHYHQPLRRMPTSLADAPRAGVPLGSRILRAWLLTGAPFPKAWNKAIEASDLFHGTDSLAPTISRPSVINIHDLSTVFYPQHHTRLHRLYASVALPRMARRARAIITGSEAARQDIITHLRISSDKVRAIHNGVNHALFFPRDRAESQQQVLQRLGIPAPYVLAVGTLEPRKNLIALLRAVAQLPADTPPLVLVGARGWGHSPLFDEVQRLGIASRVRFTGFVDDDLLPHLYSTALTFVYPSLYEGFGLPVLEALACGAPVITSNTSSLPEVVGSAAVLIDPRNAPELAARLSQLLLDADSRAALSALGPAQAARFTWQRTAQRTLEVYTEAISAPLVRRGSHARPT